MKALLSKPSANGRRRKDASSKTSTDGQVESICKEIKAWLVENAPGTSIDVLLAHPFQAIKMAVDVAVGMKSLGAKDAVRLNNLVAAVQSQGEPTVINTICSAAMNGRKRGLFKSETISTKERHVQASK